MRVFSRLVLALIPVSSLVLISLVFGMNGIHSSRNKLPSQTISDPTQSGKNAEADQSRNAALMTRMRAAHKTQNVIVVMLDGLRWQEVFHGADLKTLNTMKPSVLDQPNERTENAQRLYGSAIEANRRYALMPFLWSVIAKQGQLFGNRNLGSDSHVINKFKFSYPGYSETLTGFADPRINSNNNVPNPNVTVFEWLNAKPAFAGNVAAFGAWQTFNGIFNRGRCGFLVNAGYDSLTAIPESPELKMLNELKLESPRVWLDEPFDLLTFHTAVEYLKTKKPRLLFISLGETDDWAHTGSYPEYLNAAHRDDRYLRELWELVQSMPEYSGKTTLIVLPDHGRGIGAQWTDHGENIPGSEQTWMAFLGPDTPALGERERVGPVTDSQIAATLAALLGEDYHAAVPRSSEPITDILGK
jgi:hypothetical protein